MRNASIVLFAALAGFETPALVQSKEPLAVVATIELPNVEGRIDHLAVDREGQRLFVAALGNNTLEVVDVRQGRHLQSVKGFQEPQGVAFLPDTKQVAVANGQSGELQFLAGDDMHVVSRVKVGDDADNVRYDAAARRLYVGYANGIAAVSLPDGKPAGSAALAAHAESFQLDPSSAMMYVNVPGARQIAAIDRKAMKVVATWRTSGAESNYPMALDAAAKRLFIGCRRPAKILVVDTVSGKVTASADTIGDTDDVFYDARRKRLYVSGGEGAVDVLQDQPTGFARVARIPTAAGARTSLFVPEFNRLYVAVPHRGAQRAAVMVLEARD